MGIKSFFHKIKMGFVRMGGTSIPYVSSTKRYGDNGERYFLNALMGALPTAQIKQNVIINTEEGKHFFDKCISSDYLYANSWDKSLHCVISPASLNITTEQGLITRKDISHINITHHFSYDELQITLNDGSSRHTTIENGTITVNDSGRFSTYSLCKLDYIELGK